jgi:hypothetical protein
VRQRGVGQAKGRKIPRNVVDQTGIEPVTS